ncbi:reverse transcriptase domain-containing protein [Tanacetum coccineum]
MAVLLKPFSSRKISRQNAVPSQSKRNELYQNAVVEIWSKRNAQNAMNFCQNAMKFCLKKTVAQWQQSQFLKEKSNEAKVKNDIDVTETIDIELDHSVAKLLVENEQLHKEKENLKQTYKDLFDSIKRTLVQTKDQNDSLMAQLNKKSNENADFAKPLKNQSVVRQPTAFKSERPRISKPRFASQVDVNNDLSKPVTTHHLPKGRESALAKPHHMIAPSSSSEANQEPTTYNISEDPEDHLKIFRSATKTERCAMPTWCHVLNSTLTKNARVWFDDLPKETIDSYDNLKKAFLENYLQQKKCIKELVKIHNIRQRDGESAEEFVRRYKLEYRDVKGALECMKITRFMQEITNPELIKRLHDKIPKSVDEMMRVTTAFLRGEVAALVCIVLIRNNIRSIENSKTTLEDKGSRKNLTKNTTRLTGK